MDIAEKTARKPRSKKLVFSDLWKPHARIPRHIYLGIVVATILVILAIWSILSYGGFV